MSVFQSLAFMNGYEFDSFIVATLNRHFVQAILPQLQEVVNVGNVVLRVFVELVVESADIGILSFDGLLLEDAIDRFNHFRNRKPKDLLFLCDESLGKELI